jgi:hypothetical protein
MAGVASASIARIGVSSAVPARNTTLFRVILAAATGLALRAITVIASAVSVSGRAGTPSISTVVAAGSNVTTLPAAMVTVSSCPPVFTDTAPSNVTGKTATVIVSARLSYDRTMMPAPAARPVTGARRPRPPGSAQRPRA